MPQRFIDTDLSSLVPDSLEWEGDVSRWIEIFGDYEHLIGYGEIFWPDFIEHDGCILMQSHFGEDNYQTWLAHFQGDRQSVEQMINHIDLPYLLEGNQRSSPTEDQLVYIGRLLREMWQAKLARQFPDRELVVEFIDEPDGELMITVYQSGKTEKQVSS